MVTMTETREKPVYGMRNEMHTKLEFIRWALEEAQEAADLSLRRVAGATKALAELMDEEGSIFQRLRCGSCRTSWIDQRETLTVTHCPSCGKKQ
jgi:rubrerythrin